MVSDNSTLSDNSILTLTNAWDDFNHGMQRQYLDWCKGSECGLYLSKWPGHSDVIINRNAWVILEWFEVIEYGQLLGKGS